MEEDVDQAVSQPLPLLSPYAQTKDSHYPVQESPGPGGKECQSYFQAGAGKPCLGLYFFSKGILITTYLPVGLHAVI